MGSACAEERYCKKDAEDGAAREVDGATENSGYKKIDDLQW